MIIKNFHKHFQQFNFEDKDGYPKDDEVAYSSVTAYKGDECGPHVPNIPCRPNNQDDNNGNVDDAEKHDFRAASNAPQHYGFFGIDMPKFLVSTLRADRD